MGLKAQGLSAVKWTGFASFWNAGMQIGMLAVLARLISKNDFGLLAIVMMVLGFGAIFVEAGLNHAVIHRQDATREQLANAYAVNLILGVVVFSCVLLLAYPIASYYSDNRLVGFIQITAVAFLIVPFGMQYSALFQRDLQFDLLAKIDIVSVALGTIVAIALALRGYGVLAPIYSQIAMASLRTALFLYYGVKAFGFKLAFSWEKARFFLKFGAFRVGESTVNYFGSQIDIILIGSLLGSEILGVYYMAKQLMLRPIQLINPVITKITLPLFAKVQNDHRRLKRGFLQTIHTLSVAHFAIYFLIAGFSNELIFILMGSGWEEASILVALLSFYGVQRAIGNPVGSLLLAIGRVEVGFYWNISLSLITFIVVSISSRWGIEKVSLGLILLMLALQIPGWYFLVYQSCSASLGEYFVPILKMFIWAALCFGPLFLVSDFSSKVLVALMGTAVYFFVHRQFLRDLGVGRSYSPQ